MPEANNIRPTARLGCDMTTIVDLLDQVTAINSAQSLAERHGGNTLERRYYVSTGVGNPTVADSWHKALCLAYGYRPESYDPLDPNADLVLLSDEIEDVYYQLAPNSDLF